MARIARQFVLLTALQGTWVACRTNTAVSSAMVGDLLRPRGNEQFSSSVSALIPRVSSGGRSATGG